MELPYFAPKRNAEWTSAPLGGATLFLFVGQRPLTHFCLLSECAAPPER